MHKGEDAFPQTSLNLQNYCFRIAPKLLRVFPCSFKWRKSKLANVFLLTKGGKKTISGHTWQTGPRNYKAEKRWEKIRWKLQFMSRTPASRKPLLIFYNLTVVLELHITRRASFTSATRKTQPVSHPKAGTAKSSFFFSPKQIDHFWSYFTCRLMLWKHFEQKAQRQIMFFDLCVFFLKEQQLCIFVTCSFKG